MTARPPLPGRDAAARALAGAVAAVQRACERVRWRLGGRAARVLVGRAELAAQAARELWERWGGGDADRIELAAYLAAADDDAVPPHRAARVAWWGAARGCLAALRSGPHAARDARAVRAGLRVLAVRLRRFDEALAEAAAGSTAVDPRQLPLGIAAASVRSDHHADAETVPR
jgi:hypothetical protein